MLLYADEYDIGGDGKDDQTKREKSSDRHAVLSRAKNPMDWFSIVISSRIRRQTIRFPFDLVNCHIASPGPELGGAGARDTVRAWVDCNDLRGPAFRGSGWTLETPC